MKVLTINCTYDSGSTGKIITEIANNLSDHISFYHCYETGPKSSDNRYRIANKYIQRLYYLFARLIGLKHSTGYLPTIGLINYINRIHPDIVHIHCPYVNLVHLPYLINYLKRKEISTVITNHAEFFYTGNCSHAYDCMKFQTGCGNCNYVFDSYRKYIFDRTAKEWKMFKKAFNNAYNITMIAVSPWVKNRLSISPISQDLKSNVILNGINTAIFNYKNIDLDNYILHVTASFTDDLSDLKGGHYIIELAKLIPNKMFFVIGPYRLTSTQLPSNIILLGKVTSQSQIADYYRKAKVTVITSRRETFGMACAESLCCGTPIVGFKAGGPESIALEKYSEFVEYGDLNSLASVINKWYLVDVDKSIISAEAIKIFDSCNMTKEYNDLYKKLYSEGNN